MAPGMEDDPHVALLLHLMEDKGSFRTFSLGCRERLQAPVSLLLLRHVFASCRAVSALRPITILSELG